MDAKDFFRPHAPIENGDWVGDIPNYGTVRLKVRGMGSVAYREAQEEALRKVPAEDRDAATGQPKIRAREAIVSRLLHEVVLIDWAGIENEGKPLKYSKKLAKMWCENPDYRKFADAVAHAALMVDQGNGEDAKKTLQETRAILGN